MRATLLGQAECIWVNRSSSACCDPFWAQHLHSASITQAEGRLFSSLLVRNPSTFVFCFCHCFFKYPFLPPTFASAVTFLLSFLSPSFCLHNSCFLLVDCLVTHPLIVLHPETTRSYWGRRYIDERWYMNESQFFKVTIMVNGWIRTRTTSAWLLVWREPKREEYLTRFGTEQAWSRVLYLQDFVVLVTFFFPSFLSFLSSKLKNKNSTRDLDWLECQDILVNVFQVYL